MNAMTPDNIIHLTMARAHLVHPALSAPHAPEPVSDVDILHEAVEAVTGRSAGTVAAAIERMLALVVHIPTVEDAAALNLLSAFVDDLTAKEMGA